MSSNAITGIGTKFYRWDSDSSPGAWVALAEVNSISGPGMSKETIDVTSLDSTGGYREKIGGLRDGGSLSLSMNFTRANFDLMKDDFEADVRQNYKIILPDTVETTLEFEGIVTECPLNIPIDDKITMDVTIEISGEVDVYDDSSGA